MWHVLYSHVPSRHSYLAILRNGKIRSEEWQDKNGATVRGYKVRATSINLIGGRNEGSPASAPAAERPKPEAVLAGAQKSEPFPPMMEEGDDLPF